MLAGNSSVSGSNLHPHLYYLQAGMQAVLETDEHSAHAPGDVTTQSDLRDTELSVHQSEPLL